MPGEHEVNARDVCLPAFTTWAQSLSANRACRDAIIQSSLLSDYSAIRAEIRTAAIAYTDELRAVAADSTRQAPRRFPDLAASASVDVIMTGHQPVIFHPGILYKTVLLSRFVRENNALGILVLIDTVEGDAGRFLVPTVQNGKYVIEQASVCTESGPMPRQRVAGSRELRETFERVHSDLYRLGFYKEAQQAVDSGKRYHLLTGQPIVMANSIVRRAYEGQATYLEVPLSRLVDLPTVREFFRRVLQDAVRFHKIYNQTLDAFRRDNNIKNLANPFPNLHSDGVSRELPFWRIDGQTGLREPLRVKSDDCQWKEYDGEITPRGMLITILLRLFASDLFIHGTGGAAYDKCTDTFIKDYFGVTPPAFCVASATRYLFAQELARQERFDHRDQRLRDMLYNVERYLSKGAFPDEIRDSVTSIAARKRELIGQLKEAKASGQSASEYGKQLQQIDQRLKRLIREVLDAELQGIHRLKSEQRKLITNREFPFFYFERDKLFRDL